MDYKGVSYNPKASQRPYYVRFYHEGQMYYGGSYDTPEKAACAYDVLALRHKGPNADLQIPDRSLLARIEEIGQEINRLNEIWKPEGLGSLAHKRACALGTERGILRRRVCRPLRVSDHAVLRYLERVLDMNIDKIRKRIRGSYTTANTVNGGRYVVNGTHRICVNHDHVATVIPNEL